MTSRHRMVLVLGAGIFAVSAGIYAVVPGAADPRSLIIHGRDHEAGRRAVATATQRLREQGLLHGPYEVEAYEDGTGGWRITMWRLPAMPGGFVDVDVGPDGAVTEVTRGH